MLQYMDSNFGLQNVKQKPCILFCDPWHKCISFSTTLIRNVLLDHIFKDSIFSLGICEQNFLLTKLTFQMSIVSEVHNDYKVKWFVENYGLGYFLCLDWGVKIFKKTSRSWARDFWGDSYEGESRINYHLMEIDSE